MPYVNIYILILKLVNYITFTQSVIPDISGGSLMRDFPVGGIPDTLPDTVRIKKKE